MYANWYVDGNQWSCIVQNFEDEIVLVRNSLYLAPTGERVVDLTQIIPVAPITLPEALGGSGEWDFSDFIDILYLDDE